MPGLRKYAEHVLLPRGAMGLDPDLAAYREYQRFCATVWRCPPASFEVWAKTSGHLSSVNYSALIHKFGHVPTMAK